jgi:hypothetical protein
MILGEPIHIDTQNEIWNVVYNLTIKSVSVPVFNLDMELLIWRSIVWSIYDEIMERGKDEIR